MNSPIPILRKLLLRMGAIAIVMVLMLTLVQNDAEAKAQVFNLILCNLGPAPSPDNHDRVTVSFSVGNNAALPAHVGFNGKLKIDNIERATFTDVFFIAGLYTFPTTEFVVPRVAVHSVKISDFVGIEPPPADDPDDPKDIFGVACAVGGIAELADVAEAPAQTSDSSGTSAGVLAGLVAGAIAVGVVALGGAVWYGRRRRR